MALKIYLAGPDVFLPQAAEIGARKRELCRAYGFEGLYPLYESEPGTTDPEEIFRANCALMREADVGLFNLSPFRGPSADVGTVFELGMMFALRKKACGYGNATATYADRVDALWGPLVPGDAARRDRHDHAVEDFGFADNLMLVRAIEESGGAMTVLEEDAEPALAAFQAFEACLGVAKARFGGIG